MCDLHLKLKRMCSQFEELSEATAFILPCGNTGSEELRAG